MSWGTPWPSGPAYGPAGQRASAPAGQEGQAGRRTCGSRRAPPARRLPAHGKRQAGEAGGAGGRPRGQAGPRQRAARTAGWQRAGRAGRAAEGPAGPAAQSRGGGRHDTGPHPRTAHAHSRTSRRPDTGPATEKTGGRKPVGPAAAPPDLGTGTPDGRPPPGRAGRASAAGSKADQPGPPADAGGTRGRKQAGQLADPDGPGRHGVEAGAGRTEQQARSGPGTP
ncbi:hypothetical protein KI387_021086, partial [Taxus chinensis]